ncbi:MAG: hypothetical protein AAFR84_06470 [Pseudomonadota bacterium]
MQLRERDDAITVHTRSNELLKRYDEAALSSARFGLNTIVIVSGGAILGLPTLFGSFGGSISAESAERMMHALLGFGGAGFVALVTILISYLQLGVVIDGEAAKLHRWDHPYVHDTPRSIQLHARADRLRRVSIALATLSLVCLLYGGVNALLALEIQFADTGSSRSNQQIVE